MSKRKRKRAREPESPVLRFLRRHRRWTRRLAVLAGLGAVLAAVWFLADPLGGAPTAIDEGGQEITVGTIDWEGLPPLDGRGKNFVLPDYDQRAVRLDQFQGKTVFINFWASWCGPCEREMPDIVRTAEQFPDEVVVLAINRGESPETAVGWTRSHDFSEDLPNMYWLVDSRESVWRAYRQGSGMPQSFFLSDDAVVRREASGALEYDDMLARVEHALSFGTFVEQE